MPTIDLMTGLRIEFSNNSTALKFDNSLHPPTILWLDRYDSLRNWIAERRAELEKEEQMVRPPRTEPDWRSPSLLQQTEPAQWVQSIYSKDSPKWEVFGEEPLVYKSYDRGIPLHLPKSDYQPCPPPTRWEEAMAAVCITESGTRLQVGQNIIGSLPKGQRWAWVVAPAVGSRPQRNYLTIEREVSQ